MRGLDPRIYIVFDVLFESRSLSCLWVCLDGRSSPAMTTRYPVTSFNRLVARAARPIRNGRMPCRASSSARSFISSLAWPFTQCH